MSVVQNNIKQEGAMMTEQQIREQYLATRELVMIVRRKIDSNDCVSFMIKKHPLSSTWHWIAAYKALALIKDGTAIQIADFKSNGKTRSINI
jgi:hypothetical protein